MGTKKIEVDFAVRRALQNLDDWIEVTGALSKYSSWHGELESVVEDAVHCGIQCALGIKEPLPSERDE